VEVVRGRVKKGDKSPVVVAASALVGKYRVAPWGRAREGVVDHSTMQAVAAPHCLVGFVSLVHVVRQPKPTV